MWNFPYRLMLIMFMLTVSLSLNIPTAQSARVVITWSVNFGPGSAEELLSAQHKVAEKFNQSQDEIELKVELWIQGDSDANVLRERLAVDEGPDIIGPTTSFILRPFPDQWLDLAPLTAKYNFDFAPYPAPLLKPYGNAGKLIGIPFSVYPSLLYFNADLFDAAGLHYPPDEFGEKYVLDGKEVEWDWDTIAEISKRLTLDVNGNDANSPTFDAANIAQFGFVHLFDMMRAELSTFGGAPIVNEDSKVGIPEHWREAARWLYAGLWEHHFIPNAVHQDNLAGNTPFISGKVAIARTMLWYVPFVETVDKPFRSEIAILPSYRGQSYVPVDIHAFLISKDSKNPDAALKVLEYFYATAAAELLELYNGFPARSDLHQHFIERWADKYPNLKNWHIIAPSLDHAVVPSHFSVFPGYEAGEVRFTQFRILLYGEKGDKFYLETELDRLEADLQAIVDTQQTATP